MKIEDSPEAGMEDDVVQQVAVDLDEQRQKEGWVRKRGDGGYLPPIHRLKIPKTTTTSAKIRWLWELGYEVKEISKSLNIRYQQVRNIVTTIPKRAAREDLPPLIVELQELEDIVEILLGSELERTHDEARKAEKKAKRDAKGNTDLDDENYHE